MSFFTKRFQKQKQKQVLPVPRGLEAFPASEPKAIMPHWMYKTPYGQQRLNREGEVVNSTELRMMSHKSSAVRMCVQRLDDDVISTPWRITPIDIQHYDKQHIHRINRFLMNPNQNQEPFSSILAAMTQDVLEIDAGVIVKVYTKLLPKKMVQIYSRDGATFYKDIDAYGVLLKYWQYSWSSPTEMPVEFDPRELIYVMAHPRTDSPYGQSPVESLRLEVKTLTNAIQTNELIFRHRGIPHGILGFEGVSKEDFEAFRSYWETHVAGQEYKTGLVSAKPFWVPFTLSSRDMEFLDGQKWFTQMVFSMFNVGKVILGFTEDVPKGVAETQREIYIRKGLYPLLKLIEYHINMQLIPEFFQANEEIDVMFRFDIVDWVEERRQLEIDVDKLKSGMTTINEIRAEMGKEPVPWGSMNPAALPYIQNIGQAYFYRSIDLNQFLLITGLPSAEEASEKLAELKTARTASASPT